MFRALAGGKCELLASLCVLGQAGAQPVCGLLRMGSVHFQTPIPTCVLRPPWPLSSGLPALVLSVCPWAEGRQAAAPWKK